EAYRDAAELLVAPVEAEQVDLDVVVDLHAGQLADRLDQLLPAAVRVGLGGAAVGGAVDVRRVELVLPAAARDGHPRVARERDRSGLPAVGRDVHQDHRVGRVGDLLGGGQLLELRRGGVGPVVAADQQDVRVPAVDVGVVGDEL